MPIIHTHPSTRKPYAHRAVNPFVRVQQRLFGIGICRLIHPHKTPRPPDNRPRRDGEPTIRIADLA